MGGNREGARKAGKTVSPGYKSDPGRGDDEKVGWMHPTGQCDLGKVQQSPQDVLEPKSPRKESPVSQEHVCLVSWPHAVTGGSGAWEVWPQHI